VFENLVYLVIGFVGTLLGLEAAWHFTACSIPDKTIKPCMYKQDKASSNEHIADKKRGRYFRNNWKRRKKEEEV